MLMMAAPREHPTFHPFSTPALPHDYEYYIIIIWYEYYIIIIKCRAIQNAS